MQLTIRETMQKMLAPFMRIGLPVASSATQAGAQTADDMVHGGGGEAPYKGASTFRRAGARWYSTQGSANADFLPWQGTLRSRSRHLARNNPLAVGAIQTLLDNCIGFGLRVHPEIDREVLGLDDAAAEVQEREQVRIWSEWAESTECDLNRIQCFNDLQRLAFQSYLESGDVLCLAPTVNRPGASLQTRVQLVEADRITNPNFGFDTEMLAGGVELDRYGAPVGYHVLTSHPGDPWSVQAAPGQTQRIRAYGVASGRRNAWLLYERKRPGQSRGVPYLATVLEPLKQGERYLDQELQAAIIGGSFTVFVTSPDGAGLMPLASAPVGGGSATPDTSATEIGLDYGAICDLRPGEDIKVAAPGRPNTSFSGFVSATVELMGAGLGIPYEFMVKHFTASYSASRAAGLEFWKFIKPKRAFFAASFCSPFYELVLTEAVVRGRLSAPGFLDDPTRRRAYLRCTWRGPAQGTLNPLDEANAAAVRIREGITTLEQETAEITGGDWEANHDQRVKEAYLRRVTGLEPTPTAPPPPLGVVLTPNRDAADKAEQMGGP
jgi:lambda family phage portal protein